MALCISQLHAEAPLYVPPLTVAILTTYCQNTRYDPKTLASFLQYYAQQVKYLRMCSPQGRCLSFFAVNTRWSPSSLSSPSLPPPLSPCLSLLAACSLSHFTSYAL